MFGDERVELALVVVACFIAVLALRHACSVHRSLTPAAVAAAGIATLFGGRLVELDLEHAEVLASIVGSMLLVTAHFLNMRELRRAACCSEEAVCAVPVQGAHGG